MSGTPGESGDAHAILCRYGEIFLKSGNRGRFERQLLTNIRRALTAIPGLRVEAPHGRVVCHMAAAHGPAAAERLAQIFGLVSLSPMRVVAPDLTAIGQAAVACARAAVARDPARARSFKIDARRSDKRFPHRSYEIARLIGAEVNVATGIPVDVIAPAMTIGVEVRSSASAHGAFVYADIIPGVGGLPVGSAGKGLLLLSGGIDSPVAAYLAAKRGLALDAVYFHSPPFVGERTRDKVVALARRLARWQACRSLTVVNFTETQKQLRDNGRPALAVVLYRRMMMRIADRIAGRCGAEALVTGETLSQVASQTLRNMSSIDAAARRLVMRPLLTYDKVETIALAQKIGTFALSTLPHEDACSLFMPDRPATGARVSDALAGERGLDVEAMADAAAETAETMAISADDDSGDLLDPALGPPPSAAASLY